MRKKELGMRTRGVVVATTAAALLLAGFVGTASAADAADGKVKCEGVNSCKGHGDCKSAQNSCKGENGCAGKGFKTMSQAECDAAKAKAAEKK
jgi:hypothetical protein